MPYLEVIRNEANSGCARSRNLAFQKVTRRYVTYLDVDDWYKKGHLDELVRTIEEFGVSFVRTSHVMTDGNARKRVPVPSPTLGEPYAAVRGIGRVGEVSPVAYPFLWAGIYDTEKIPTELFAFDETLRTAADRPWFWRLYMSDATALDVPLDGYFYRKDANPKALTQQGNSQTLHFLDAMAATRDLVLESGNSDYIAYAAFGVLRLVGRHLKMRARLSSDLQQQLYRGSHQLLASFPSDARARALSAFSLKDRIVFKKIINMKPTG
jgi:glycosyltransferase involved in cell wall biosynthesis